MDHKHFLLTAAVTTAIFASGCSKETAPSASEAKAASGESPISASVTSAVLVTSTKVVSAVSAVASAPTQAVSITNNVVVATKLTAATNGVQSTLERTQALIAQQKYTEAAGALGSLRNQSLSGEQQSLWQTLQAQVQKGLAAKTANDGTKALGGLLGK